MTKKHVLLMALCCLTPVIGYAAMSLLGIRLNAILFTGMVLLCPILHLIVMLSTRKYAHDDQPSRATDRLRRAEEQGLTGVNGGAESE